MASLNYQNKFPKKLYKKLTNIYGEGVYKKKITLEIEKKQQTNKNKTLTS